MVYPILEEVVFRGALQSTLTDYLRGWRLGPVSVANLLASVAFSAAHGLLRGTETALLVFIPSLIFGYFRDRHRSLASPIALHVFYNAGYFWIFGA